MQKKNAPQKVTGLTPKSLFDALTKVSPFNITSSYHAFRGIENLDDHNRHANYCYAISFLQLLFHSQNVLDYFRTKQITHQKEILFKNIIDTIYSENNNQAIEMKDFVQKIKCWEGRKTIPNEQCDVALFGEFLLNFFSEDFSDLFLHDFVSNEEKLYETDEDSKRKYFVQLPISNTSIQQMIEDKLQICPPISKFPKSFLLSLLRQDTNHFNKQCISINSFIHIQNHIYKFAGAVALHLEQNSTLVLQNKQINNISKLFKE